MAQDRVHLRENHERKYLETTEDAESFPMGFRDSWVAVVGGRALRRKGARADKTMATSRVGLAPTGQGWNQGMLRNHGRNGRYWDLNATLGRHDHPSTGREARKRRAQRGS